ncbi:ScbR family autoregulator-binding transcription factor [Streptomyces sp. NPDC005573]|uniref:ScbR family autoregulator-binding transcription factor n=1 Tax=unclassified Streptomyces TaxID=2593676 RepID=UPI0033A39D9B
MALQERAIRTRRSILVAAADVFADVGYEAATISEILQRAGVTKGALYFHFASKEQLAQAVLTEQLEPVLGAPPRELVLQEGLDTGFLLAHLLRARDPMVCGSVRLTVDQGSPQDGLDRRVPMAAWIEYNAALLTRARASGELLPHVDVDAAAKAFVAAFTGAQVLSKIMNDHADLMDRVADLYQHLMTSVAVPAVLVRLDISPDRGRRVYDEAVALSRESQEMPAAG